MDVVCKFFAATFLVAVLFASSVANAILEGRNLDGNTSTFEAYYDTDTNLTWLADANFAQTSGYDADGFMTWQEAMDWITNLNINGVTGWRLPTTIQPDPSCSQQVGGIFGPSSQGSNCIGSEMGNLYYNLLGGVAGVWLSGNHNANYDLFSNIMRDDYWSSTEFAPDTTRSWMMDMLNGSQQPITKDWHNFAWAVHDGEIFPSGSANAIIRGKVWYDSNINGIQEIGEPPIAGERLFISGSDSIETITDVNGEYEFNIVFQGSYEIGFRDLHPQTDNITQQDQGGSDVLDSDIDPVTRTLSLPYINNSDILQNIDAGIYSLGQTSFLPLDEGNTWTYNVSTGGTDTHTVLPGTFTVGSNQATRVRDSEGNDELYVYGSVTTLIGEYAEDIEPGISNLLLEFSPGITIIGNSMDIGQTSVLSGAADLSGTGIASERFTYTGSKSVIGYETVNVPAGSFATVKIVITMNLTGTIDGMPFDSTERITSWLAADIGVVKIEDVTDGVTETRELISYFDDIDGDGIVNAQDLDDDNDGVPDTLDAFPLDASESSDRDGDGVGDNADAFPNDPLRSVDLPIALGGSDGGGGGGGGCSLSQGKTSVDPTLFFICFIFSLLYNVRKRRIAL
ncbi:MAG: DUF1566 domain-containing protein [Gammaproteobacteria bacterium]|nr:DUF1566 domain-containing protein [Gammaproteobacteria bacterium]